MGRTAGLPFLQVCVPASPLDISGVPEGRNPDPGTPVPAVDRWGDPAAAADRTGCQCRKVALSFSPLDPWDQAAAQGGDDTKQASQKPECTFSTAGFSEVTSLRPYKVFRHATAVGFFPPKVSS